MAPPSTGSGFPSLLCAEDNTSIFDDADYFGGDGGGNGGDGYDGATWQHRSREGRVFGGGGGGGGGGGWLPVQSEECIALMVQKQNLHLPHVDYLKRLRSGDLDLGARREAIDWIVKAHAHFGFGPLCAYLSINYLDRFLSAYELPKGKAWMTQLLSVACLSLAVKMEETDVPLCLDLQVGESKFVFEARTIQRMELLVLSTLSWRMQAITPFSFIDHFLSKISNEENPARSLITQSIQLILSTIKGIDFMEFRPSEIAAAVAIGVIGETKAALDTEQAISLLSEYVEKERLVKCFRLMNDMSMIGGSAKGENGSLQSVPQSPIEVLDAACLSYRSDDTTTNSGSCANSTHHTPVTKRRKLNRPCEV